MEEVQEKIIRSLRRIDGQVRGIEEMIRSGRDCTEILYQIVAAREALKTVAIELSKQHVALCTVDKEHIDEEIGKILKIIASFS
ncbi:metal-sensitive transcriptional regulator [Coprothermobacteraceae bacterium]|nr:metal-sensitive transcriptional regulator [Coprothermobacteraceae bacterium]